MFDPTTVISSLLSSAAVSAALVFLARTWITERLKASIKHEYDVLLARATQDLKHKSDLALEGLRTTNAELSAIQAAGLASFTDTHRAAHERRLAAIDVLWKEIARLRTATPPVVSAFDMYPPRAYSTIRVHPRIAPLVAFKFEEIGERLAPNKHVDEVRPYLDPYLYALFYAYRALPGRIAFHIKDTDVPWWQDDSVKTVIVGVLDQSDFETMNGLESGQHAWFQQRLEAKILERASQTIIGADASEASLTQAKKLVDIVSQLQLKNSSDLVPVTPNPKA